MHRLDKIKRELLIEEIEKGKSINNISGTLRLAKSTIYFYYKKIRGKRYKLPIYSINFSEKEGEILGIFVGDGSQHYSKHNWNYQTNIHFGNNLDYANYVKNLYETYFNKKWPIFKEITKEGKIKYRLRVIDKNIFEYFSNYLNYIKQSKHNTVRLKTLKVPKRFKIGFLRGLLDTDGSISKDNNSIRINYYTTSKVLAKQVYNLLTELKIKNYIYKIVRRMWKDLYNIQISRKDSNRFLEIIKPYKIRKLGL